jgi:mannose-6-phosphate isomerase-like protein (cupin superfamily)
MLHTFVRQIDLPGGDLTRAAWVPHHQFHDSTASVPSMGCHYSILAPGHSPHPPHAHVQEEILIVLDGTAEILIASNPSDPTPQVVPMTVGQFSYYPAGQHHTLRNASDHTVTYLMLWWSGVQQQNIVRGLLRRLLPTRPTLPTGTFDLRRELVTDHERGFATVLVFEGATKWLRRLQCHLTRLKPGAGYAAHTDAHDVAIVLLDGSIETAGTVVTNRGIAYFGAGEPHGMHNPGGGTATYLVFEFDRNR